MTSLGVGSGDIRAVQALVDEYQRKKQMVIELYEAANEYLEEMGEVEAKNTLLENKIETLAKSLDQEKEYSSELKA